MRTTVFALVLAAGVVAGCGGGAKSPDATATPALGTLTATASLPSEPTANATPTPPSPETRPAGPLLRIGEPVPLPAGLVVYSIDGTWEGPTAAIRRTFRTPSGEVVSEPLLESVFTGDASTVRGITSMGMSLDRRQLAAGLCHGYCYGDISPVTIVRSFDGGVTWDTLKTIEPTGGVHGVTNEFVLAVRSDGQQDRASFALRGVSESPWSPPATWVDGFNAVDTPEGLVLYVNLKDRVELIRFDGTTVATIRPTGMGASSSSQAIAGHGDGLVLFTITHDREWSGTLTITQVSEPANERVFPFTKESGVDGFWPAAWLSPTTVLGRGSFQRSRVGAEDPNWTTGLPAILDITTGVVSPIAEFMSFAPGKAGGPVPFAVATGTFARVAGAGDCLNVRAEPATAAAIVGCFADRVFLRKGEGEVAAGGRTWLAVETPDGRLGWAAAEFLELATRPSP